MAGFQVSPEATPEKTSPRRETRTSSPFSPMSRVLTFAALQSVFVGEHFPYRSLSRFGHAAEPAMRGARDLASRAPTSLSSVGAARVPSWPLRERDGGPVGRSLWGLPGVSWPRSRLPRCVFGAGRPEHGHSRRARDHRKQRRRKPALRYAQSGTSRARLSCRCKRCSRDTAASQPAPSRRPVAAVSRVLSFGCGSHPARRRGSTWPISVTVARQVDSTSAQASS